MDNKRDRERQLKIAVLGAKGLPFTGGLEIIMEEIGQRFVNRGYGFDVFVRKQYMKGKENLKNYKGIGLKYSTGVHSKHLDAISHTSTALIKIIFSNYGLVYINAIGISVLGFIPKIFRKKIIIQVHGLDFKREKWGFIAKLFLRFGCHTTVWFADRIICVSLQDQQYFEKKLNKKCDYIPNGVSFKKKLPPNLINKKWGLEKDGYILFMARLVKEKGCHFLLDAYDKLNTKKILVIAGDNSHREPYSENLKKRQNERILFTGFVDGNEKVELLSNAYCYVLPSTLEAMPLSLLEAMSFGNCIIASDLPELKSVLGNEGLTFKVGNVIDLKDKLKFVLSNPEYVRNQEKIMMDLIKKNHDWNKVFEKYFDIIRDLLK